MQETKLFIIITQKSKKIPILKKYFQIAEAFENVIIIRRFYILYYSRNLLYQKREKSTQKST